MTSATTARRPTEKRLAEYLRKPYTRVLIPDPDDGGYVAEVLELPGCVSQGETPEQAYANVEDAMRGYIAASLTHDRPVPEPIGPREYSGNFALRMSSEQHRAAALRAAYEGVSLNHWIAAAIAERLGASAPKPARRRNRDAG